VNGLVDALEQRLGVNEKSNRESKDFEDELDYRFKTKVRWD
jgi:hypothetical protein